MTQPPTGDSGRMPLARRLSDPSNTLLWIGLAALLLVLTVWLSFTPQGILGKADAVGYAVCHRISVRSFHFPDGRAVPLCARCSGTFLGVLVGLLAPGLLFGRRHAARFPKVALTIVLLLFSAWWAFDGANSFMHLLPESLRLPRLFEPNNFLRLTTGMLHGITMGSLILPIVNATLWADAADEPTVKSLWELLALVGIGAALVAMVYSEYWLFLYPLAVLSSIGVLSILGCIMTVMVATLLRRETQSRTLRDALPLILLGLAAALLMIAVIDAARLAVFGTWDGFVMPGA
ncbi:MAG: DUF2085 domain-containing protein [Anaerolineae bacterium]|nr:DUF2085 domain-containing protein [Anaerolineae bacterium]